MSNVSPEEHREHLWETHAVLVDAHRENSRSQDRTVITLAGGALVLSAAFLSDVWSEPRWVPLLVAAWILFGISVGAVLLSYQAGTRRLDDSIEDIKKEIYHGTGTRPPKEHPWIRRWNMTALWAFFAGLVAIGMFATINVLADWI